MTFSLKVTVIGIECRTCSCRSQGGRDVCDRRRGGVVDERPGRGAEFPWSVALTVIVYV